MTQTADQEHVLHHESPRKRRGPEGGNMQPKMDSFIDVIFLLLIYFVITASFTPGEGIITARLPQGTGKPNPLEPPKQPLSIILSSKAFYEADVEVEGFGGARDFQELQRIMIELQYDPSAGRNGNRKPDDPVVIKPAGDVRWEHVVNTFNAAVAAKYKNIAFAQASQ